MAAYAYTFATKFRKSIRIGENLSIIAGTIDVTNYNSTTKPEITEITKKFKSTLAVVFDGLSDAGFAANWDDTSVKCWAPTQQTASVGDRAGAEAATDTDCGQFEFIAIGFH